MVVIVEAILLVFVKLALNVACQTFKVRANSKAVKEVTFFENDKRNK